jgi:hypothetical protein
MTTLTTGANLIQCNTFRQGVMRCLQDISCKSCILGLLRTQGDKNIGEIRDYCYVQATNFSIEQVNADINDLMQEKAILQVEFLLYHLN